MKSTPIALTLTDTHLHSGNIELVTDIWDQAIKTCLELKIKKIFFIGDFFTARKAQELGVDDAGRNIINRVIEEGLELDMIPGNHDKVDADSAKSYLDEYHPYTGVNIINTYANEEFGDLVVHWIPYFKENSSYGFYLEQAIQSVIASKKKNKNQKHILLTHIAVNGVRNNDGSVVGNDLTGTQFSHFDEVWVGHYHNKSFIDPNIKYIGSAYQSNFGEDDQKGFTILNDDGTSYFIQSKFRKFIQVKLDVTNEKSIKAAEKEYKGNDENIRFVFEGEEADLKKISKEKLAEMGIEATFKKDSAVPLDNTGLIEKANSVSFNRKGIDEAFDVFLDMKHVEDREVGIKYLNKI